MDEFLMGGEIQDTSKKSVLKAIEQADLLQEVVSLGCLISLLFDCILIQWCDCACLTVVVLAVALFW